MGYNFVNCSWMYANFHPVYSLLHSHSQSLLLHAQVFILFPLVLSTIIIKETILVARALLGRKSNVLMFLSLFITINPWDNPSVNTLGGDFGPLIASSTFKHIHRHRSSLTLSSPIVLCPRTRLARPTDKMLLGKDETKERRRTQGTTKNDTACLLLRFVHFTFI